MSRAFAGGLYNASDARSAALGGEETAQTGSALSALDSNPAALATIPSGAAAITLTGALLRGEYQKLGKTSQLRSTDGFIASGAVALPALTSGRFASASRSSPISPSTRTGITSTRLAGSAAPPVTARRSSIRASSRSGRQRALRSA